MIRQLRRLRRNPILLGRYVVNNPKTAALAVLGIVGVVAVVVLSFTVALIPRWVGFLGVAALSGYVAVGQWGRLALILRSTEAPPGEVAPGLVEVSGTARAPDGVPLVTPDEPEGEYLAYKRVTRVDTDPGTDDDPPFLDADAGDRDVAAVPLYVTDETGTVLVDTNNADVRLDWDDVDRSSRETRKWAGLEPGDPVTVYGTAMPPASRRPPGVVDAMSEVSDRMRGVDFDDLSTGEDIVISKSPQRPYLILSDRSGIGLLGRQLVYFGVTGLVTLGLVAAAVLAMVGIPVV
jgi:hypothetical protein